VGIIERYGRFKRYANPGCVCVCYPIEEIAGEVSLRVQQLDVTCETKTSDNVFVMVHVSVQFEVIREKIYESYYSLQNHQEQMRSYIYDTLRAAICMRTLDQAFDSKDEISDIVKSHLRDAFDDFGFKILQALVTDLSPNNRVRDAMNEINASKRIKEASYQKAEGEKMLKVKRAEAEAESMYLQGVGVARSRHAIMDGLKESIVGFSTAVNGASHKDVMDLLILTQYFDTLQDIGGKGRTVFLPSDDNQVRNGILQANA
jgi:regulator of protease activity HflC (stomatin/prohibitin superfamily)